MLQSSVYALETTSLGLLATCCIVAHYSFAGGDARSGSEVLIQKGCIKRCFPRKITVRGFVLSKKKIKKKSIVKVKINKKLTKGKP